MKKFIQKVQDLSQKAAQIQQAVKDAPGQVAHLREAATQAFQQIRQEVESGVADLKIQTDDKLAEALREIDRTTPVFRRAGYVIDGVDIEFGVNARLLVHMDKVEEVAESQIRTLLAEHAQEKVCCSILSSLIRAEEIEDKIRVSHLAYREVTVVLGVLPSIRLCWRPAVADTARFAPPQNVVPPPIIGASAPPTASSFVQSSYFEPRTTAPVPAITPTAHATEAPLSAYVGPVSSPAVEPPKKVRVGHESLERFKKMPDLSR